MPLFPRVKSGPMTARKTNAPERGGPLRARRADQTKAKKNRARRGIALRAGNSETRCSSPTSKPERVPTSGSAPCEELALFFFFFRLRGSPLSPSCAASYSASRWMCIRTHTNSQFFSFTQRYTEVGPRKKFNSFRLYKRGHYPPETTLLPTLRTYPLHAALFSSHSPFPSLPK